MVGSQAQITSGKNPGSNSSCGEVLSGQLWAFPRSNHLDGRRLSQGLWPQGAVRPGPAWRLGSFRLHWGSPPC